MEDPLAANTLEVQLIGKAHMYLEPLLYGVGLSRRMQILDERGDYAGKRHRGSDAYTPRRAGLLAAQLYFNELDIDQSNADLFEAESVAGTFCSPVSSLSAHMAAGDAPDNASTTSSGAYSLSPKGSMTPSSSGSSVDLMRRASQDSSMSDMSGIRSGLTHGEKTAGTFIRTVVAVPHVCQASFVFGRSLRRPCQNGVPARCSCDSCRA